MAAGWFAPAARESLGQPLDGCAKRLHEQGTCKPVQNGAMITVHHLETSRSQRILWLLEELGLPYQLKSTNATSAPVCAS